MLRVACLLVLGIVAGACSSGTNASQDAGGDGSMSGDAGDASDANSATDAADAADATSSCPSSGDPAACDDGTGSLGAATACPLSVDGGKVDPTATASYHVRVTGSKFATSGACVYVTPSSCPTTNGDVVQFAGGGGTGLEDGFNEELEKTPYCFRLLDVQWDSDWEDDGMTTGGPVGMGGDMLAASQKPQALITWVYDFERTSTATPLCARGNSGGSSELLYELMHNAGEAQLDHVQIVSATPFARVDEGCDPTSPTEGTNVVCSALPTTTEPEYNAAATLVRTITHDPNCDADAGLGTSERASLRAMSLVPTGFSSMTMQKTSLSVYMCSNAPNATQGQAVDVFGVAADLATTGAGPGLISLTLATPFYACAANASCPPHVVCGADCSTEGYGTTDADKMEILSDMQSSCVMRH
jgi:hypothetical protein